MQAFRVLKRRSGRKCKHPRTFPIASATARLALSEMRTFCFSGQSVQRRRRGGRAYGIRALLELRAEVGEVREERVVWVNLDLGPQVRADGLVELGLVDEEEGLVRVDECVCEEHYGQHIVRRASEKGIGMACERTRVEVDVGAAEVE